MANIKLKLQYDGTNYSGWQIQPNVITVEKIVADSIERILQERIKLIGATRTDAGVHALGQVANFHTSKPFHFSYKNISAIQPGEKQLLRSLNSVLPKDICIKELETAEETFHSRFDAKSKIYKYQIWRSPIASPFYYLYSWHIWSNLNIEAMRSAGKYFLGERDFTSFRGSGCDAKTSIRRIDRVEIENKEEILEIWIEGSGFLKHMVRNIVGTLVKVGIGKINPEQIEDILKAKDRRLAGPTAPAKGLFLVEVKY